MSNGGNPKKISIKIKCKITSEIVGANLPFVIGQKNNMHAKRILFY